MDTTGKQCSHSGNTTSSWRGSPVFAKPHDQEGPAGYCPPIDTVLALFEAMSSGDQALMYQPGLSVAVSGQLFRVLLHTRLLDFHLDCAWRLSKQNTVIHQHPFILFSYSRKNHSCKNHSVFVSHHMVAAPREGHAASSTGIWRANAKKTNTN